jgi:hypothetical protein
VDRVVRVFRSFEDADAADDQFYAELTPEARLDMLLELVERQAVVLDVGEVELVRDVRTAIEQIDAGGGISNRDAKAELRRRFGR